MIATPAPSMTFPTVSTVSLNVMSSTKERCAFNQRASQRARSWHDAGLAELGLLGDVSEA